MGSPFYGDDDHNGYVFKSYNDFVVVGLRKDLRDTAVSFAWLYCYRYALSQHLANYEENLGITMFEQKVSTTGDKTVYFNRCLRNPSYFSWL